MTLADPRDVRDEPCSTVMCIEDHSGYLSSGDEPSRLIYDTFSELGAVVRVMDAVARIKLPSTVQPPDVEESIQRQILHHDRTRKIPIEGTISSELIRRDGGDGKRS